MSDTKKEEEITPQEGQNNEPEPEKKEEQKNEDTPQQKEEKEVKEVKEETVEKEIKEEKETEQKKEENEVTTEAEKTEEKEVKEEKVEKENDKGKEDKKEEDVKEKKELTDEEEDRKELYDAIKDLKPEDASDNVKSKLILLSEIHLDKKRVEDDQYGKEFDELQDRYDKQYQEIYDKIDEIVNSTEKIEITPEEKDKYGITETEEPKAIDDYWEKVIINSRYFTITDRDKVILKYLSKVKIVKFPENVVDFRVDFYFKPNEFFTNEILSKKYIYGKDALLRKAEGTEIDWKSPDKNTTIEKVKKRIKKGKKFINEYKETKVDSFFSFFAQVDDMNFISDEVTFFKEDLFGNQLEYYMDIVTKTKNAGLGEEDDELDDDGYNEGGNKGGKHEGNDGKKEECKQRKQI